MATFCWRACLVLCLLWAIAAIEAVRWDKASLSAEQFTEHRIRRASDDNKCGMELQVPARQFNFQKETGQSIEIEWLGKDSKTMFVLCSYTAEHKTIQYPSSLWRSVNGGLYYTNETGKLVNDVIRADHGMLKSPADPRRAILIGVPVSALPDNRIFITRNAGYTWQKAPTGFALENIVFHPTRANLLLANSLPKGSPEKRHLYLSLDFGTTWKLIIRDVLHYAWGSTGDSEETIYASYGQVNNRVDNTLARSDDLAKHWTIILKDMRHFLISSKFIFASVGKKDHITRNLYVSERSGKDHTWLRCRTPLALPAGGYYVLDTHEGVAFIHLDMTGKGVGIIYTSDTQGVNYMLSLRNHVHHMGRTDFYAVKSMRATYITTISSSSQVDTALQSRITFNRGGRWHPLKAEECSDPKCSLHIHGLLAINGGSASGVMGPLSVPHAHGLILAHGMTGEFSDPKKADVYVTRDGGYNWKKVRSGVHNYVIADLGKLLVAVPLQSSDHLVDTLYYSLNYGGCWQSSSFSTVKWHFTGILADPLSMSMGVTLWGYTPQDGVWQTVTMEFDHIVERKCNPSDYISYTPHSANNDDSDQANKGCLFGKKESVQLVKADVWCRQAKTAAEVTVTTTTCPCVRSDFECDYGYVLKSNKCQVDTDLPANHTKAMRCSKGEDEYRKGDGYIRVPGDICVGGVANIYDKWVWAECPTPDDPVDDPFAKPKTHKTSYVATVFIFWIVSVVFIGGVVFCFWRQGFFKRGRLGRARYVRLPRQEPSDTEEDDNDDTLLDVSKPPLKSSTGKSASESTAANGH